MKFIQTELSGVILIEPRIISDDRGFFYESYKKELFKNNGIVEDFVQDNHSYSSRGVIRGLHYQIAPSVQAKLVIVGRGEILDVVVDLRPNSPTCGRWIMRVLSEQNGNMLYVPDGFAHGFCALKDAIVLYKCSAYYSPQNQRGIAWDDADLSIKWPDLGSDYIVSERDRKNSSLKEALSELRST